MSKKQKTMLLRIIISGIAVIMLHLLPLSPLPKIIVSLAVYGFIGHDILRKAVRGIRNHQVLDENFLMALATVGAVVLALYQKTYDFTEAIAVMLFYQLGELFEGYAVGKSRKNISALMDIRPDYANIEENGQLVQVDPEEVSVGTVIVVRPGERIPIDGMIVSGNSSVNTAALTGESLPQDVMAGDEVISGCVNMTGLLRIKTTREFEDSTVSKILELVEEASSKKARSENFIAKFSRVYTPVVVCSALALALLPPVVNLLTGNPGGWDIWLYRGLTFLVISCPCALVISIPLSFFAGIGGASREGILIKGSCYMETLAKVKTVVLDKTGTLTQGTFQLTGLYPQGISQEDLLTYAALAECASSHPISQSLTAAYGKEIDRRRVTDVKEIGGMGVLATVDGKSVAAGNEKWMTELGLSVVNPQAVGTVVHIAINGNYAGYLLVADTAKPNAQSAIGKLKSAGIQQTVMLTGDNKPTADAVGNQLGIDKIYSQLLPGDKVEMIEQLLSQNKGALAFVGDGINDAPVLSRADVGIAMGGIGSDAAIEAADIVLMDDDPQKIAKTIQISRKTLKIVYENIFFALGVKFVCLILGAFGIANMGLAIFADVGVMVLAVLNAMRALRVK